MKRTVIKFEPIGKSVAMTLDDAPIHFTPKGWKINLQMLTGISPVDLGQQLVQTLIKHEPVKSVLRSAFQLPVGSPPSPLYFHIRVDSADAIPWEQLHVDGVGFCALDARWPIGRIANQKWDVAGRTFAPPLRLVAVLSAAGQPGGEQLQALLEAVDRAEMTVLLHVISGDENLLATVPQREGVTSEAIKGTSLELCQQVAEAKPHVLHILCHGGAMAGVRVLNFGLIDDFDQHRAVGSLSVPVGELVAALKTACDPWLVVLAACETAEAADLASGRALAHQMVDQGLTAVIGMRRLVDLTATNRFCAALYPEVISEVSKASQPAAQGEPAERIIDWAGRLTNPRRVMRDGDPAADSWLDPVLYAQNDELKVIPSDRAAAERIAELQGTLDQLRAFLDAHKAVGLEPGVEADVNRAIAQTKDQIVRAQQP
jgi:hypothetical protein